MKDSNNKKRNKLIAGGVLAGAGLASFRLGKKFFRKGGTAAKMVEMAKNEVIARVAENKGVRKKLVAAGKIALASYNGGENMTRADHIMSKLAQNEVDRKTTTTTEGNKKTTTTKSKATLTGVRNVGTAKMKRLDNGFQTDQAIQLNTPDGKRYYEGIGKSRDMGFSRDKARFDAIGKYMNTPSDSLTTQDFNKKYMSKKSEFIMNKYAGLGGAIIKGLGALSGKARKAAIEAHNKAVAKSGKFKNVNIKDSAGKNVVNPSSKPSKVPEGYKRVIGKDVLDYPDLIKSIK